MSYFRIKYPNYNHRGVLESLFLHRESKNNSIGIYLFSTVVSVAKFFVVHICVKICVKKKENSLRLCTNVPYMEETTTFYKLTILIQPIDIITIFNTLDTV